MKNKFFAATVDELANILYIEKELDPTNSDWRNELTAFGHTTFDYHGWEFVEVRRVEGCRYLYEIVEP